jgi:hypothetical protein
MTGVSRREEESIEGNFIMGLGTCEQKRIRVPNLNLMREEDLSPSFFIFYFILFFELYFFYFIIYFFRNYLCYASPFCRPPIVRGILQVTKRLAIDTVMPARCMDGLSDYSFRAFTSRYYFQSPRIKTRLNVIYVYVLGRGQFPPPLQVFGKSD